jgi:hypothetical protein
MARLPQRGCHGAVGWRGRSVSGEAGLPPFGKAAQALSRVLAAQGARQQCPSVMSRMITGPCSACGTSRAPWPNLRALPAPGHLHLDRAGGNLEVIYGQSLDTTSRLLVLPDLLTQVLGSAGGPTGS